MITVVGGGFAGTEAAWAAAQRGAKVRLYEMRPDHPTGAHQTGFLAELVCSNSFKSKLPTSPAGQLKAEMVGLGSIVIPTGEEHAVPGGEALCVDRDKFSAAITEKVECHPNIELCRGEFTPDMARAALADGPLILATGPLTSRPLAEWMAQITGRKHLYFYDAVSPTVEASSVDMTIAFAQSRYDKGGDDYLNCPFEKDSYYAFVEALKTAERALPHGFASEDETLEKIKYFAGCTPIEAIADGGDRSLAFGNFKPVGLTDPRTGRRPYAAIQLRPENKEKTLYSLVACQNRLKWGEQKRVFHMVPGLENAEFVRFGVIHKNTYIESPKVLTPWLEMRDVPGLFIAGQLTGVEGYVESAAMGIYAGIAATFSEAERETIVPPRACAYGSLVSHLQDQTPREFAPMNINWGLFPEPDLETRDKGVKRAMKLEAAQLAFEEWSSALRI
jgi:methylenetetrahydrofolate--tRNA-(uracil-5-)-methyltransferase